MITRLPALDVARGVLAVTVVICHLWPEASRAVGRLRREQA